MYFVTDSEPAHNIYYPSGIQSFLGIREESALPWGMFLGARTWVLYIFRYSSVCVSYFHKMYFIGGKTLNTGHSVLNYFTMLEF